MRDDQVGQRFLERLDIELVDRLAAARQLAHARVDLARRQPFRDDAACQMRQVARGRGIIALVRDRDDLVAQPKGEQSLGRGRYEAGDPHEGESRWLS